MHWLNSLEQERRDRVYGAMRTIRERSDQYDANYRKLAPRAGELAVGAADWDEWHRSDILATFLNKLYEGMEPDDAKDRAEFEAYRNVRAHNKQRPKDVNWQRWEESGFDVINWAWRLVNAAR